MAYQGTWFNGQRVHPHAEYTGLLATLGNTIDCSGVNQQIINQLLPNAWVIYTYCMGIWCSIHNPLLQHPATQNVNHVLRCKLEPSNGACRCHGVSVPPWPPADPNSILLCTPGGTLAGHVHWGVTEEVGCT